MKKQIVTIALVLFALVSCAQTEYSKGFKAGYKEGYCYNDYGCVSPIPPVTPIPNIGERNDNYQDGYNRGFKMGLEDKQRDKQKKIDNTENFEGLYSGYSGTNNQKSENNDDAFEYNLLLKALEINQAQVEKNQQIKKEKTIIFMNQVKSYYNSLNTYPDNISNGWHKVISTNNYDFCEERKVYVENNKVTKYVINDWIYRNLSFSTEINKAKSMVQTQLDNGSKGDMVDLYFLEFINNPNSYTAPPVGSGKICFWSNVKRGGTISIYVENTFIGELTSYFKEGTPDCEQSGTLTFKYKTGTYKFTASNDNSSWEGTITITEDECSLMCIGK